MVEAHWRGVAFQFSKKRKAEAPPAPAASRLPAPPSHLLRTPGAALTTAAAATAAPSPFADDVWMSQQQGERLLAGVAALPERAPPAQRLLAFAASLGEAAVAGAGPRAPALAAAYASFQVGPWTCICATWCRSECPEPALVSPACHLSARWHWPARPQDKLAAALTSGRVQLAAPPRPPATPGEDGEEVRVLRAWPADVLLELEGLCTADALYPAAYPAPARFPSLARFGTSCPAGGAAARLHGGPGGAQGGAARAAGCF